MRILFDNGTPATLIPFLPNHQVSTAADLGWPRFSDGEMIRAAESHGFDLLLSTDQNLVAQQNLSECRLAIVVLRTQDWRVVRRYVRRIERAVNAARPGTYTEIDMPFR